MKTILLITCLSASLAALASSELIVSPATPATPKPLTELTRLQKEFDQRRSTAIRPVMAWYRAQLEALQRTEQSAEAQQAITKALKAAREAFWQNDQPELWQALVAQPWIWRSSEDAEGVTTSFKPDGSVVHIGMRGIWRITGPCEVTVTNEADEQFILRFNASLSAYEANRKNVSGHRLALSPPTPR